MILAFCASTDDPKFIPKLMELHRSGHFPIERLCKVYPVEKLEQAMGDLKNGSVSYEDSKLIKRRQNTANFHAQVIKPIIEY